MRNPINNQQWQTSYNAPNPSVKKSVKVNENEH